MGEMSHPKLAKRKFLCSPLRTVKNENQKPMVQRHPGPASSLRVLRSRSRSPRLQHPRLVLVLETLAEVRSPHRNSQASKTEFHNHSVQVGEYDFPTIRREAGSRLSRVLPKEGPI